MVIPLLDKGDRVSDVPAGEDSILVELPDEIEKPFDDIDKGLLEDVV